MSRAKKWNRGSNSRGYKSNKGGDVGGLPEDIGFDEENGEFIGEEEDFTDDIVEFQREPITSKIYMWEFGQNDPKRDSGSKLRKLGYASLLKLGQTFPGIVLSSEATIFVSPKDIDIVANYGISGINCSWNRLDEIPFNSMGKGKNQRLLPILLAANTVNYGKPSKLNTAEAIAACLYITGYKEDARIILSTFSYGEEFIKLNAEALEAYSKCAGTEEVNIIHNDYIDALARKKNNKEIRNQEQMNINGTIFNNYIDESDLPPQIDDDEYYYDDNDEIDNNEEENINEIL